MRLRIQLVRRSPSEIEIEIVRAYASNQGNQVSQVCLGCTQRGVAAEILAISRSLWAGNAVASGCCTEWWKRLLRLLLEVANRKVSNEEEVEERGSRACTCRVLLEYRYGMKWLFLGVNGRTAARSTHSTVQYSLHERRALSSLALSALCTCMHHHIMSSPIVPSANNTTTQRTE